MARVSVIIPCYNYSHLVGRAIESVLNQTYRDLEIIVVDDGSTDECREVVEKYRQVRYIYQVNQGPNAARNKGIMVASSSEFIAFLDADDEWLPHKLEKQIKVMDTRPLVGLVYSKIYTIEECSGAIIGTSRHHFFHEGHVMEKLFMHQFVPSPTPLIRRNVFERVGCFDPKAIGSDDWEMWLRISAHFEFAYVSEPLAKYTVHKSWGSHTTYLTYERDMLAFFDKAVREYPEKLGPLQNLRLFTFTQKLGWYLVRNGESKAGLERLRRAVSYCPLRFKTYLFIALSLIGPSMTKERYRVGRVKFLQGKHSLFNRRYRQAMVEFSHSITSDPLSNPSAYIGLILTFIGQPFIKYIKSFLNIDSFFTLGPKPSDEANFQQWG